MKYIYIDAGCYDGDTVKQFRNWKSLTYADDIGWKIYAFDPNPNFKAEWKKQTLPWIQFEQKAVWTEDGEIEFALCEGEDAMGSTVMKEKDHWELGKKITVPCFDFSKWLEQFRGDHVVIKMDIEGAEGKVLTKMIKDGTDDIPSLLLIEWHDAKLKGYESNRDWIWDNLRCRWSYFR